MRHTDLADVLRRAGLNVVERPGWKSRGFEMGDVRGVLCHHTAGPPGGNAPSLGVVENGIPGKLAGPLSQFLLARDGTWFVVAAGGANHAGLGGPAFGGVVSRDNGNPHLLGVEAENTGIGEPWPLVQYRSYVRGVAALLKDAGLPASRAIAHREWAPTRKIDPKGIDMTKFRDEVAAEMEDDMPSAQEVADALLATVIPGVVDPSKKFTVAQWIAGANEGAWKAADRASWMALGKPGAWHDGGGTAEEAEDDKGTWKSGGRQLSEFLEEAREDLIEIKAKVTGT